jgi:hypothetical protein
VVPIPWAASINDDPLASGIEVALMFSVVVADAALAEQTFILATGRRDPRIYAIDFNAALKSPNASPNAGREHVRRCGVLGAQLRAAAVGRFKKRTRFVGREEFGGHRANIS